VVANIAVLKYFDWRRSGEPQAVIGVSIRRMSNTPPPGFPPYAQGPQMPWPPAQLSRVPARWPVFAMFAITLVAVGAAVAAWLRPMPEIKSASPSAPAYSDQQASKAKAKVCGGNQKVRRALSANATRSGGDDPTAQLAVAVNARQIYEAGSAYLLTLLREEPATPADLATAAGKLASLFQILTLDGLAADPNVQGHDSADQTLSTIDSLCK
jgi:hypothetical protein